MIFTKFMFPLSKGPHNNFGFEWPSVLREKDVENNGRIHAYSPGAGAYNPQTSNIFQNYKFSANLVNLLQVLPFK